MKTTVTANSSCPGCGQLMHETTRTTKAGYEYVWYRCTQPACNSHWLVKYPAKFRQLFPCPWEQSQIPLLLLRA